MKIVILCATYWEIQRFINQLEFKKIDWKRYQYSDSKVTVLLELCGVGQEHSRKSAEKLIAESPNLVISTGFAGALLNHIKVGDLACDIVRSEEKSIETLTAITNKVGVAMHKGTFWSCDSLVSTIKDKQIAAEKTGAIAVEMESQSIFEVCRTHKIPFCSIRAISDSSDQHLPSSVQSMGADGKINFKFIVSFLCHPFEWPDFIRLARASRKAGENLSTMLSQFIWHY